MAHHLILSIAWMVAIVSVFAPLCVTRYRTIDAIRNRHPPTRAASSLFFRPWEFEHGQKSIRREQWR
jgi:hypothetical protein